MPVRIALLGCGPCGMATLYQYAKMPKDKRPEIVCYEKQKTWGGLWNFSWRIGIHVKITYEPPRGKTNNVVSEQV